MCGRTVESTMASGKKTTCRATEFISTLMAFDMKDNSLKIRRQATGNTSGRMAGSTMGTGIGVNSTGSVFLEILRRRKRSTESGNRASDCTGSSSRR